MKYLLISMIKLYQKFYPVKFRRRCLFKESCSNYVHRKTKEEGFIVGLKSLKFRFHNCKPGYYLTSQENSFLLITANNEVIEEEKISNHILEN